MKVFFSEEIYEDRFKIQNLSPKRRFFMRFSAVRHLSERFRPYMI
jgi:hypothetical protein